MSTESPMTTPSHDAPQETIPDVLTQPAEVADMAGLKGNVLAAKTPEGKKREAIKLIKSSKFSKNALKAKAAQLRGKPLHVDHGSSSGNRRRQP